MACLTRLPLLTAALLVAGCGDRAAAPRATAATPVIVTGNGDTIPMRETLRVGVLDGDPNYQFNRISWMLARQDGGVLLHDMVSNTKGGLIRQYDAQGQVRPRDRRAGRRPRRIRRFSHRDCCSPMDRC